MHASVYAAILPGKQIRIYSAKNNLIEVLYLHGYSVECYEHSTFDLAHEEKPVSLPPTKVDEALMRPTSHTRDRSTAAWRSTG